MNSPKARLTVRPSFLPRWAWSGYQLLTNQIAGGEWDATDEADLPASTRIEFFNDIVANRDAEPMWRAMEERRPTAAILELEDYACCVLEAAHISCAELTPVVHMSAQARKDLAGNIELAAKRLKRNLERLHGFSNEYQPGYPSEFRGLDHQHLVGQLHLIGRCAAAWSDDDAKGIPVAGRRPGSKNWKQNYFVESMTNWFEAVYEKDFRLEVIQLSHCIDFEKFP